jgi:predicted enzyme related to lactoylglutathione lyase
MIRGVNKVFVYADDKERAKRFWVDTMGFGLYLDSDQCPGGWVEVSTPDERTILIIDDRPEVTPVGRYGLQHVAFFCLDLKQTYKELTERGVEFPEEISEREWGLSTSFKDSEGNQYNLGERRTDEIQPVDWH